MTAARFLLSLALLIPCPLFAQNNAVGLTIKSRAGTFGVSCGPFTCVPANASAVVGSNQITAYAWPQSPVVIALSGLPSSCVRIPGLGQRFAVGPWSSDRAGLHYRTRTGVH